MQRQERQCSHGFTLIELVMAAAIIILLAGIVYAALAPVREKGRQTVCVSNLKQIGMALRMYRDTYGGIEADVGVRRTYAELGLPFITYRLSPYVRSEQIFICPNDTGTRYPYRFGPRYPRLSYFWYVWREDERFGDYPRWSECVAYRGEEYVVSSCHHHHDEPPLPFGEIVPVPVLRLSGRAQVLRVSLDTHTYLW